MKSILRITALFCIVLFAFTACKKQLSEKSGEPVSVAVPDPTFCFYTGIGHAVRQNDGSTSWKNVLLRWFDNSRRVINIKIKLDPYMGTSGVNVIDVEYGEVKHATGTIRLIDVSKNHEVMRVIMNASHTRPIVSWYDGSSNSNYPMYDTSYYTYDDAMDRIQSIRQHARFVGSTGSSVTTWNFAYDPAGNLVTISPAGSYGGYEFRYDYTKLDSGMASVHYLSPATKTLEYLSLLKFEHHHQLTSVIRYEPSGYPSLAWGYQNIQRNSKGQVISYGHDNHTWYTSWDCYGSNPVTTKNPTQEEFMKMVH